MGFRGWFGLAVLTLQLGGCANLYNPAAEWPQVGNDFVQRLRWRDYSGAANHVEETRRSAFLAWAGRLEALQLVDGRLESFVLKDNDQRAEAVAVLDYYRLPSARVRSWQLLQQWEYQGAGKLTPGTWQLISAFPDPPE